MSDLEASGSLEEPPPPYMIFIVVFLFFLTGLLGFMVCHLLKKKGYRCRTGDMEEDEEEEEKLGANADEDDEDNQDTVEQILKCIIENEANMEAFNEMFGTQAHNHEHRVRKESVGAVPPHHHTVHSGSAHNSCHLCAQVRSKKGRRQSRTPRSKHRPGEQTVFSVGRFRVTHTDKKLHGGPNPMVGSGDQLDQSQDSEDRKEGGYNLRSMFKDVRAPSDGSNGVAPSAGKRRKSLTIFGLRRGSDPTGVKIADGTGKDAGGVRFAIRQQPVVPEELLQAETPEPGAIPGPGPGSGPGTETTKNLKPVLPQNDTKTLKDQERGSGSGSRPGPGPPSGTPSSLPIASSSQQTFKVLKPEEAFDPGPQQTSTPLTPMPGSIAGPSPGLPESSSSFPVTQTPPDHSSSPDAESGFGASLALMSLGSSPSLPIKTPTSPGVTPSPRLTSRTSLTPSPKLPAGRAVPDRSTTPVSPQQEVQKPQEKRPGILKTSKRSPGDPEGSPTDQLVLPLTPTGPRTPTGSRTPNSPIGGRISNVTMVKASPDSQRVFSVVTMVDQAEPGPGGDQKGGSSPAGDQKGGLSPIGDQKGGPSPTGDPKGGLSPVGVQKGGPSPAGDQKGGPSPAGDQKGGPSPRGLKGGLSPTGDPKGGPGPAGDLKGGLSPIGDQKGGPSPAGDQKGGLSPTGDPKGGPSPAGDQKGGLSPVGVQKGGPSPTGDLKGGLCPTGDLKGGLSPTGDPKGGPSPTGPGPAGDQKGGSSPTGDPKGGPSPTGDQKGGLSPRGDPKGGPSPTGPGPTGDQKGGPSPTGDQKGGLSPRGDPKGGPGPAGDQKGGSSPAGDQQGPGGGLGQGPEVQGPGLRPEKDDMVQMEDIRGCTVTQEGAGPQED